MEVKGIVTIGLEHIHPHPDNPRKDLGDLTELAESIKKNGIMQNLTVIPKEGEPGEYITIIGHRRSAAAKLAGVTEAPCRVVEGMTDKEQMSTMLEENMQRNDLTIWEQAQGFQMMLDLGETEDTIAEKTGFSKKTIRHRLNIAKLDSKTLMEKERQDGYQLSLTDLYELEKIKDVKTRDKILKDSTDSRDLARRAINAQKEQKRQENMKLYVAMMKKLGLKKAPKEADSEFYTDKWERMKDYSLDKEPPKTMKFEDDGEPMFYLERYGTLHVIRKKKKEKKVLTPEEEAKKQNMRNKKQIKAILKEAANTRKAFIEGILSGRIKKVTDEKQVEADLFEQMMDWETFTGHNKLIEFFVGCEVYATTNAVRVDFMKFKPVNNTVSGIEKGDFYCYEVKSSVEDFHSKNGHNFLGDYNYYVMPEEVYEQIKKEIPYQVGVYVPDGMNYRGEWYDLKAIKKAKRKDRSRPVSEMLLMMFRSAARDRKKVLSDGH